ncbi:hypothetical protein RYX36_005522 [Vicia faba]
MTSAITSRAAFGKICKDQQEFLLLIKKLVKIAEGFIVIDLFPSQKWLHVISGMKPKLEMLHKKFDNIIENIIKEAVEKSYDEGETVEGFLSVLLRIKDHDDALECPLTIDNIKAVILFSMWSGSITLVIPRVQEIVKHNSSYSCFTKSGKSRFRSGQIYQAI